MVRGEKAKTATLVYVAACLAVCIVSALLPVTLGEAGLRDGCTVWARLAYPFFHASIYHLIGNCWVLLCIAFYYEVPLRSLIIAYVIAITAPAFSVMPTVGASAVVFALMGQVSFTVRHRLYFHYVVFMWVLLVGYGLPMFLQAVGKAIAYPNNLLHIYCYLMGMLVGFLNSPVSLWRRRRQ